MKQIKYDSKYFRLLDKKLLKRFGEPTRTSIDPTDSLVRGILSQNTNDKNRDKAFAALKEKYPVWDKVVIADDEELKALIRPAGMANQRVPRIKGLLTWLAEQNNGRIDASFLLELQPDEVFEKLTTVSGIGVKTAAVFLLFCAGAPFFPVDTHIKRIMGRLGVLPSKTPADKMIFLLSKTIPSEIHFCLHLNLLVLGRKICTARKTHCDICPVKDLCSRIAV